MAHAFTFYFTNATPDSEGPLSIITVTDLFATCGVCGYEEIQRFYRGVPFHTLTWRRFHRVLDGAPALVAYSCSHCGTAVTRRHVTGGAVGYGFADGEGFVRGSFDADDGQIKHRRFTVRARGLDPQELPPVRAPEQTPARDDNDLEDDEILEETGRVFHLKEEIRRLLKAWASDATPQARSLADGLTVVLARSRAEARELVDERGASLVEPFHAPTDLAGLLSDYSTEGHITRWLDAPLAERLASGEVVLAMCMKHARIEDRMSSSLRSARLEVETDEHGLSKVTTPHGDGTARLLSYEQVAELAAANVMTPREAARLVAERIVAELLGLAS